MFGKRPSPGKRAGFAGWLLMLVLGAGVLLLLTQTTFPAASSETLATQAAPEPAEIEPDMAESIQSRAGEEPFLTEYEPSVTTFLTDNPDDGRPLWQVGGELLLKMTLVIGLLYAALAGLRWLQRNGGRPAAGGDSATIRVLETTGLAPGRALHLVVVGEKTLLIGATDQQLSLLAELADTSVPLPDDPADFFETLEVTRQATAVPTEWQVTLDNLRHGLQHLRQSVGR